MQLAIIASGITGLLMLGLLCLMMRSFARRLERLVQQLEDLKQSNGEETRDRLEDADFAYSAPRHHFLGIGGELKVKPRGGTDWTPVLHRGERVVPASALERAAAAASDASRREADEIARRPISADLLNPASPVADSGD